MFEFISGFKTGSLEQSSDQDGKPTFDLTDTTYENGFTLTGTVYPDAVDDEEVFTVQQVCEILQMPASTY